MALKPITRKEQIIAGKELEPITRMERFLKEYGGGSGGEAISWNDLTDRPFYEEVTETTGPLDISWDGDTSGKEIHATVTDSGATMYMCRVSDAVLTLEDLSAGTLDCYSAEGSSSYVIGTDAVPADLQEAIMLEGAGIFVRGGTFPYVVSLPADCLVSGMQFSAGTYFLYVEYSGALSMYVTRLSNPDAVITTRDGVIRKLDNKYIDAEWMATTYIRDITILDDTELDNTKEIDIGVTGAAGDEVVFVRRGVEVTKPVLLDLSLTELKNENCFSTGGFSDAMSGNNTIPFVYWGSSSSGTIVTPTADKTEIWTIILRKKMYNPIPEGFLPESEPGVVTIEVASGAISNSVVDEVIRKLQTGSRVMLNYAGMRYCVIDANIDTIDGYGKMILSYAGAGLSGSHVTGGLYICYMVEGGYVIRPLNTPSAIFLSKSGPSSGTDYKLSIEEDGRIHVTSFDDETDTFSLATKGDLEAARPYVILNSSTEGSTKQFKITVDDSGTISATEV